MVPKCFLSTPDVLYSSYTPIIMHFGTSTCVVVTTDRIDINLVKLGYLAILGHQKTFFVLVDVLCPNDL